MSRAGKQPALVVILGIAGVIGFGVGTWLGNVVGPAPARVAAVSAAPSAATTNPSLAPTATPIATAVPTQVPGAPRQILALQGDSDDISDSFEVNPGWQIQWQVQGTSIAVAVTGDQNLGVLIEQEGPKKGVTGIAPGGAFRLEITADGPWSITVIDGQEPASS
jgi:hypothetical protein